jgi:ABC-type ATPase with predicted acetyltransferase domain
MALLVARRRCGLTLRELAAKAGGVGYAAVQVAVRRLAERVGMEKEMQKAMAEVIKEMTDVET